MNLFYVKHKGNFNNLEKFLNRMSDKSYLNILDEYGKVGVQALSGKTPKDTGKTAESWEYRIYTNHFKTKIVWRNTNKNDGVEIALILDRGHGTGSGAYIQGRHFIEPAIQPVFDAMVKESWKEVTR